jgi:large subunit ribosomal protein L7/L12
MSETETKTFEAKITQLGDSIASLTLKEAVDLADYMKDKYGIEPAAGGAVVMAGGGGEAAPAAAAQTEFDVILEGCPADK